MADKTIGDLTAATTPLSGEELLEIEQGGNSRKVPVSDISFGDAEDIDYDNATSGLAATDVQAAIDEIVAGGGGDWEQIGAPVTASSGTSVAFTSIPADYTDLMIEVNGVRSTHVSNNPILLDISSDNGSSWSSGDQTVGIIFSSSPSYGRITFGGYLRSVGAIFGSVHAVGSDPGVSDSSSYGHGTRHSADINAIRIRILTAAFTGSGTFTLFGRK